MTPEIAAKQPTLNGVGNPTPEFANKTKDFASRTATWGVNKLDAVNAALDKGYTQAEVLLGKKHKGKAAIAKCLLSLSGSFIGMGALEAGIDYFKSDYFRAYQETGKEKGRLAAYAYATKRASWTVAKGALAFVAVPFYIGARSIQYATEAVHKAIETKDKMHLGAALVGAASGLAIEFGASHIISSNLLPGLFETNTKNMLQHGVRNALIFGSRFGLLHAEAYVAKRILLGKDPEIDEKKLDEFKKTFLAVSTLGATMRILGERYDIDLKDFGISVDSLQKKLGSLTEGSFFNPSVASANEDLPTGSDSLNTLILQDNDQGAQHELFGQGPKSIDIPVPRINEDLELVIDLDSDTDTAESIRRTLDQLNLNLNEIKQILESRNIESANIQEAIDKIHEIRTDAKITSVELDDLRDALQNATYVDVAQSINYSPEVIVSGKFGPGEIGGNSLDNLTYNGKRWDIFGNFVRHYETNGHSLNSDDTNKLKTILSIGVNNIGSKYDEVIRGLKGVPLEQMVEGGRAQVGNMNNWSDTNAVYFLTHLSNGTSEVMHNYTNELAQSYLAQGQSPELANENARKELFFIASKLIDKTYEFEGGSGGGKILHVNLPDSINLRNPEVLTELHKSIEVSSFANVLNTDVDRVEDLVTDLRARNINTTEALQTLDALMRLENAQGWANNWQIEALKQWDGAFLDEFVKRFAFFQGIRAEGMSISLGQATTWGDNDLEYNYGGQVAKFLTRDVPTNDINIRITTEQHVVNLGETETFQVPGNRPTGLNPQDFTIHSIIPDLTNDSLGYVTFSLNGDEETSTRFMIEGLISDSTGGTQLTSPDGEIFVTRAGTHIELITENVNSLQIFKISEYSEGFEATLMKDYPFLISGETTNGIQGLLLPQELATDLSLAEVYKTTLGSTEVYILQVGDTEDNFHEYVIHVENISLPTPLIFNNSVKGWLDENGQIVGELQGEQSGQNIEVPEAVVEPSTPGGSSTGFDVGANSETNTTQDQFGMGARPRVEVEPTPTSDPDTTQPGGGMVMPAPEIEITPESLTQEDIEFITNPATTVFAQDFRDIITFRFGLSPESFTHTLSINKEDLASVLNDLPTDSTTHVAKTFEWNGHQVTLSMVAQQEIGEEVDIENPKFTILNATEAKAEPTPVAEVVSAEAGTNVMADIEVLGNPTIHDNGTTATINLQFPDGSTVQVDGPIEYELVKDVNGNVHQLSSMNVIFETPDKIQSFFITHNLEGSNIKLDREFTLAHVNHIQFGGKATTAIELPESFSRNLSNTALDLVYLGNPNTGESALIELSQNGEDLFVPANKINTMTPVTSGNQIKGLLFPERLDAQSSTNVTNGISYTVPTGETFELKLISFDNSHIQSSVDLNTTPVLLWDDPDIAKLPLVNGEWAHILFEHTDGPVQATETKIGSELYHTAKIGDNIIVTTDRDEFRNAVGETLATITNTQSLHIAPQTIGEVIADPNALIGKSVDEVNKQWFLLENDHGKITGSVKPMWVNFEDSNTFVGYYITNEGKIAFIKIENQETISGLALTNQNKEGFMQFIIPFANQIREDTGFTIEEIFIESNRNTSKSNLGILNNIANFLIPQRIMTLFGLGSTVWIGSWGAINALLWPRKKNSGRRETSPGRTVSQPA